jgi:hypothetical protein
MRLSVLLVVICACGGAAASSRTPSPPVEPISAACNQPERHQLDFWLGTWDVVVRAKAKADDPDYATARGTNHVTKILGGCVVTEDFHADGPGAPWAGRSVSQWVAADHAWHQTWVDDSGGYLLFDGALVDGMTIFTGLPRTKDGVTTQKRMVFHDLHPDAFQWRWEATTDGGATWRPEMLIDYTRARM